MLIGVDASRALTAHPTGTEMYSLQLIRTLVRMDGGHRFRLYTNGRPSKGLFWQGSQPAHVEVRSIPFPRLWTHVRLSGEMLADAPDVLFVPAHVLPLIHPHSSVVTVHDLGYLYYPEAHRRGARRYLDWSTAWNARHASLILADSEATRADLVRAYGADPARVRVVYLGHQVVAGDGRTAGDDLPARVGPRGRYLLYVGTLQPRKNLQRVVAAFARVAGTPLFTGVNLVLAGRTGWLSEGIFAEVERFGLRDRVLFPGYVADADLPALYRNALAYVFPSLYEGFGLPVLEAQGCGVPVMTSNNSSLPEVAGDAALLVDPHDVDAIADAMYRLATDEALRRELIRARSRKRQAVFVGEMCTGDVGSPARSCRAWRPAAQARQCDHRWRCRGVSTSVCIAGLRVDALTYDALLEIMAGYIAEGRPHQIATLNPEFVILARRDAGVSPRAGGCGPLHGRWGGAVVGRPAHGPAPARACHRVGRASLDCRAGRPVRMADLSAGRRSRGGGAHGWDS